MTVRNGDVSTGPGVQVGSTDISPPLGARALTVVWVATIAAAACSSARIPPSGIPEAPSPRPAVAPPPAAPAAWDIERPQDDATFVVETTAMVAAHADTLALTDTVSTHTALRIVPRGFALDVHVETFVARRGAAVTYSLPAPLRALGRFDDAGAIAFEGSSFTGAPTGSGPACPSPGAAAFDAARDLWVRWPPRVAEGERWRDSATVALCRDGVPLTMTLVRDYRLVAVEGDSIAPVLVIERATRTTLGGRGAIRGDSTTVSGTGTGSATLRVNAASGWIVSADVSATLQLRAQDVRRTQFVEQRTRTTVRQGAPVAR